ncbi:MAG TPA: DUF2157 domain-containing protein, partial [Burkholderiales bacterium]|nr:DUF2157 domain-containing protein [Burkholderiales bacterium]
SWQRFLDQLLLWLGALLLAAGVIFFFAYNWNDLGRIAKFGLVEALIVAALIVVWRIGLEHIAGKVTLLAVSLFVGALLALVGQTYQTGADTFELFAAWAVLILPWVLVGRLAALWLVWLGLLNLAVIFYYMIFGGLFGFLFDPEKLLWVLFAVNTVALVAWEIIAARNAHEQWAVRLLATASGGLVTALALYSVAEFRNEGGLGLLAWAVYFVAVYVAYRHMVLDVYILAGGVLSVIVVVTTWLATHLMKSGDAAGAMLFIGLVVIGLSAAGGWWLKRVVNGARS